MSRATRRARLPGPGPGPCAGAHVQALFSTPLSRPGSGDSPHLVCHMPHAHRGCALGGGWSGFHTREFGGVHGAQRAWPKADLTPRRGKGLSMREAASARSRSSRSAQSVPLEKLSMMASRHRYRICGVGQRLEVIVHIPCVVEVSTCGELDPVGSLFQRQGWDQKHGGRRGSHTRRGLHARRGSHAQRVHGTREGRSWPNRIELAEARGTH